MRWTAVVFALALLALGYQIHQAGIASRLVDPFVGIRAQDEAVYAHSAIRMAQTGDWMTPSFMGRHALYKPPMLFWLTGLSVRLLGVSPLSLRLPSLLAGALVAALLFAWLRSFTSLPAAAAAALLLVSSSTWHRISRLCLTDALLALCLVVAVYVLYRDPRLTHRSSLWVFAAASAAAILTKGVAGLLPSLVLLLFTLLGGRERPSLRRLAQAGLLTAALAAPWHLYQSAVHPRWFWAEYIHGEIFIFGLDSPYQSSPESHHGFYLRRLMLTDPLLSLLALAALPAAIAAWRSAASPLPRLLLCWIAVVAVALLVFQYRNASYVSLLIPALALLAVAYSPLFSGRRAPFAAAALGLVFLAKAALPNQSWGLDFQTGITVPSATALNAYARMQRPNELVVVSPDDAFYSAVLPLPRVRYCFIDPSDRTPAYGLDFRHLGINVSASQFVDLDRWRPLFHRRLREWNLNSDEPVATVIVVRSLTELSGLIAASPRRDFLLPASLQAELQITSLTSHRPLPASSAHVLLLSRP